MEEEEEEGRERGWGEGVREDGNYFRIFIVFLREWVEGREG